MARHRYFLALVLLLSAVVGVLSRTLPFTDGITGANVSTLAGFQSLFPVNSIAERDVSDGSTDRISCGQRCYACKGDNCDSNARKKRNLYDLESGQSYDTYLASHLDREVTNSTLTPKRQLQDLPSKPEDLDLFVDNLAQKSVLSLIPPRAKDQYTRALMKYFSDYKTKRLAMGTAKNELTGCTMLTVVSTRAVYMGHFYENLGFVNYDYPRNDPEPADFTQNVENLIRGHKPLFRAKGDALDVAAFTGDGEQCFAALMVPRYNTGTQAAYYPDLNQRLVNLILELIPGCRAVIYEYWARPKPRPGHALALFEYESNADGKGNADWRLWYENVYEQASKLGMQVIP